jgi:hypothetical protein
MDTSSHEYSEDNAKFSAGRYYEANYNVSDITNDLMITARKNFSNGINTSLLLGHNIRARRITTTEAQTNEAGGLVIPGFYNLSNSNGPIASFNSLSVTQACWRLCRPEHLLSEFPVFGGDRS